jgi:GTP-binding protein HflX
MQTAFKPLSMLFVYLADTRIGKAGMEHDITELWHLVQSLGDASVVDLIVQKGEPFRSTYIGPGKAAEIAEYLKNGGVDVIVFNGLLTVNQKFNLTKLYWGINPNIEVWDRTDLILAIFSRHAHTTEANLQIDLARMRHMGPRIFGMGMVLSRQGGGIGTRGIGETNTELMRRHWKREIKRVTDELDKLTDTRERQISHRKSLGLPTVSLVGYTNAGKTSLYNALTHKRNLVENALFATLDSTVGEVFVPALARQIMVSDTIGFIQDLPPDLIDAFKSTLLESVSADVVLHVVDASDPDLTDKVNVVNGILYQLGISEERTVLVFNKLDVTEHPDRYALERLAYPCPAVFLSAKTRDGFDGLFAELARRFGSGTEPPRVPGSS